MRFFEKVAVGMKKFFAFDFRNHFANSAVDLCVLLKIVLL